MKNIYKFVFVLIIAMASLFAEESFAFRTVANPTVYQITALVCQHGIVNPQSGLKIGSTTTDYHLFYEGCREDSEKGQTLTLRCLDMGNEHCLNGGQPSDWTITVKEVSQ